MAYMATKDIAWILFPLCVRGFGMIASMIALFFVRAKESENAMNAFRGHRSVQRRQYRTY